MGKEYIIMRINSITAVNFNLKNNAAKSTKSYFISNQIMSNDSVSFTSRAISLSATEKLTTFALDYLKQKGFHEGQKILLTGESKYLPVMNTICAEAYKQGSGRIKYKVIEPELESLKKKYNVTNEIFDYEKKEIQDLENDGALFINLDKESDLYKRIGLSKKEINVELEKISPKIPQNITRLFKINPQEIFRTAMDIHEGQPVRIYAEREHLPFVLKLADWLYSQNKTKKVFVDFADDSELNLLKYAKEEVLDQCPQSTINLYKEDYEKDVANLVLEGEDPKRYAGISSERIIRKIVH